MWNLLDPSVWVDVLIVPRHLSQQMIGTDFIALGLGAAGLSMMGLGWLLRARRA